MINDATLHRSVIVRERVTERVTDRHWGRTRSGPP